MICSYVTEAVSTLCSEVITLTCSTIAKKYDVAMLQDFHHTVNPPGAVISALLSGVTTA